MMVVWYLHIDSCPLVVPLFFVLDQTPENRETLFCSVD